MVATFRNRIASALSELRGNPLENPATPLSAAAGWLLDFFGASHTAAGVMVSDNTALLLADVFSCINVLTSDASSMTCRVYEEKDGGRTEATRYPLYNLLASEPNPEMTAPDFISTWLGSALLTGNGYAEIQRDKDGAAVALWPRHPHQCKPVRAKGTERLDAGGFVGNGDAVPKGALVYEVNDAGVLRYVSAEDMLHLKGFSRDGWVGLSPIAHAKETIGLAVAAERFASGFFGKGSRPSGLLTNDDPKLSAEQRSASRENWEKANSGENQGRTAVLWGGWKWTAIGVAPGEAQFLETRQYTRTQICGLYRVPPHMIGDTSRLSNSNHESQSLEYFKFSLRPWLVRMEAELGRKLLPTTGRKANAYAIEFDPSDMLRGEFETQMTGFATGMQWSFFNPNEVRRKLRMNPIGKQGDVYLAPLNMVPLKSVGEEPEPAEPGSDVPAPQPAGNGGQNQRMLLERMASVYAGIFGDAVNRFCSRSRQDAEAVSQVFGPVLDLIASEAANQASWTFRVQPDADLGREKILRDYRAALLKRSAAWSGDAASVDASAELGKAVRAIVIGIYREAGATVALAA